MIKKIFTTFLVALILAIAAPGTLAADPPIRTFTITTDDTKSSPGDKTSSGDKSLFGGFKSGFDTAADKIGGRGSGLVDKDTTIAEIILRVINWVLGLAAVITLAVLIWGGVSYIISLGNEEKTRSAKRVLLFAIVGILIIGASFVVVATIQRILIA